MHHKTSKSKADFWSPSGLKSSKDKYLKFQKMYQHRRQNRWNEPFEVHDALPIVLKDMAESDGKLGEMKIDMKFTKTALERYDELNKNPDFMTVCKGPDAQIKLLDLLELDIRILLSCDLLATKGRGEIRADSPRSPDPTGGTGGSVLRDATSDADNSDSSGGRDGSRDKSTADESAPDGCEYLRWQPYAPMDVQWKELRLTAENATECSNFFPACAFFFYIDELGKAHPEINNALHKAWLRKFKKPMSAEDLDPPPDTFNAEAKNWYQATIGYLQDKLTDVERGLRGLPRKERRVARTKAVAIEKAKAKGNAKAAKLVPRGGGPTDSSSSDDEIITAKDSKRCI